MSEIEWSSTDDEKLGEEKLKLHFKLADVRCKKQKKKKTRETTKESVEKSKLAEKVDSKMRAHSSLDSFDSEDSYYIMSEPSKKRSSDSDSICIVSTDIDSESDKDPLVMDKSVSKDNHNDKEQEKTEELPKEEELNYMVPKVDHFVTSDSSENDDGGIKKSKESLRDAELIATEVLLNFVKNFAPRFFLSFEKRNRIQV